MGVCVCVLGQRENPPECVESFPKNAGGPQQKIATSRYATRMTVIWIQYLYFPVYSQVVTASVHVCVGRLCSTVVRAGTLHRNQIPGTSTTVLNPQSNGKILCKHCNLHLFFFVFK